MVRTCNVLFLLFHVISNYISISTFISVSNSSILKGLVKIYLLNTIDIDEIAIGIVCADDDV